MQQSMTPARPPLGQKDMPVSDGDPAAALTAALQSAGIGDAGTKTPRARSIDLEGTADLPIHDMRATMTRPDKFVLESRLIELGAALMVMQQSFKLLERDFYLAAFGRYDD